MFSRLLRIYVHPAPFYIFALGIFFVVLGLLCEKANVIFWATFFTVLGGSFIAVSLTAPISEFFQSRALGKYMTLLRGALDTGMVEIFSGRIDAKEAFVKAVGKEIACSNTVLFAGVGLPDFFEKIEPPDSWQASL